MRVNRPARLLTWALAALTSITAKAAPVSFNDDVRPILNEACFKCHSGVKEAGGLNLQFREQALGTGKSGARAIVPNRPEESAFIARLITDDEDERMPKDAPPATRKN